MKSIIVKAISVLALAMATLYADLSQAQEIPMTRFQPSYTVAKIRGQLNRHLAPDAVPLQELATFIYVLAEKYDVNASQIARVVLHESKGREMAFNKRTQDHGIMQLNYKTLVHKNISMACAYSWKCALEAGVKLLSELNQRPNYRICMYNVGPAGVQKRIKNCLAYERQLAKLN